MAKIDQQLAAINDMLKQILAQTSADTAEDQSESESENGGGCPYCGCNGEHGNGEDQSKGPMGPMGKGRMIVMVSKKKGAPSELPPILKDLLKTMTK